VSYLTGFYSPRQAQKEATDSEHSCVAILSGGSLTPGKPLYARGAVQIDLVLTALQIHLVVTALQIHLVVTALQSRTGSEISNRFGPFILHWLHSFCMDGLSVFLIVFLMY
jgi:K+ transporter